MKFRFLPFAHKSAENSPGTLRFSVRDAMWFSVMLGAGEAYLSACGVYLGGSPSQISFLATIPFFVASLGQFAGLTLLDHIPDRKKLLVCGATVQGLLWCLLGFLPLISLSGWWATTILIALTALAAGFGAIVAPAWSSLIGDLVAPTSRGKFFGYRNFQAGQITFLSLIAAGLLLEWFRETESESLSYSLLFFAAGTARLVSAYYLGRHDNPTFDADREGRFTLFQFLKRSSKSNFGRFVIYFGLLHFSVFLAGPYFSIYLLRELELNYIEYLAVIGAQLFTQFYTMRHWGALTDEFGNKQVLLVSGIGISVLPFVWLVSSNIYWLILIQMYGGFVWAGFNLSAFNFLLDSVTPQKRARCSAYMAGINGICILLGSLVGNPLVTWMGKEATWLREGLFTEPSQFFRIFFISGVIRLVVTGFFWKLIHDVREVSRVTRRELIFRVAGLRPLTGVRFALLPRRAPREAVKKPSSDETTHESAGL